MSRSRVGALLLVTCSLLLTACEDVTSLEPGVSLEQSEQVPDEVLGNWEMYNAVGEKAAGIVYTIARRDAGGLSVSGRKNGNEFSTFEGAIATVKGYKLLSLRRTSKPARYWSLDVVVVSADRIRVFDVDAASVLSAVKNRLVEGTVSAIDGEASEEVTLTAPTPAVRAFLEQGLKVGPLAFEFRRPSP